MIVIYPDAATTTSSSSSRCNEVIYQGTVVPINVLRSVHGSEQLKKAHSKSGFNFSIFISLELLLLFLSYFVTRPPFNVAFVGATTSDSATGIISNTHGILSFRRFQHLWQNNFSCRRGLDKSFLSKAELCNNYQKQKASQSLASLPSTLRKAPITSKDEQENNVDSDSSLSSLSSSTDSADIFGRSSNGTYDSLPLAPSLSTPDPNTKWTKSPTPALTKSATNDDDIAAETFEKLSSAPSSTSSSPTSSLAKYSSTSSFTSKMWPPWPFNLLTSPHPGLNSEKQESLLTTTTTSRKRNSSTGGLFWLYFQQQLIVGVRGLQEIGGQLWFHLPPSAPPIILLSAFPRSKTFIDTVSGEEVTRMVVPLISNPIARTLILGGLGLAILSWAHSDIHHRRKLVPLPLNRSYQDINKAILPHFLPEQVIDPYASSMTKTAVEPSSLPSYSGKETTTYGNDDNCSGNDTRLTEGKNRSNGTSSTSLVSPNLQRHWNQCLEMPTNSKKTIRTTFHGWKRMREVRKIEAQKVRRMAIFDELMALQTLKKQASKQKRSKTVTAAAALQQQQQQQQHGETSSDTDDNTTGDEYEGNDDFGIDILRPSTPPTATSITTTTSTSNSTLPLGYALVTGASRGIGRAIAIELARWEVPLILVARDVNRLRSLAYDIEACYGVKCYIIQADLSLITSAEEIYKTTTKAKLNVDILINNAGISTNGFVPDTPIQQIENMIQVNAMSVAKLVNLYSKDMMKNKRGRILMVSSVVGACSSGGPSVAIYAATKAFEYSLSLSLAKELERYGVGVTCLLPGAVRDTEFRTRSNTEEALCWKIPFYPRKPDAVASQGVRGLLRGDTEVTPGWQNRIFLKLVQPAIPQRIHNNIVEMAWRPVNFPNVFGWRKTERQNNNKLESEHLVTEPTPNLLPRYPNQLPPTLLQFKGEKEEFILSKEEKNIIDFHFVEDKEDEIEKVEDDFSSTTKAIGTGATLEDDKNTKTEAEQPPPQITAITDNNCYENEKIFIANDDNDDKMAIEQEMAKEYAAAASSATQTSTINMDCNDNDDDDDEDDRSVAAIITTATTALQDANDEDDAIAKNEDLTSSSSYSPLKGGKFEHVIDHGNHKSEIEVNCSKKNHTSASKTTIIGTARANSRPSRTSTALSPPVEQQRNYPYQEVNEQQKLTSQMENYYDNNESEALVNINSNSSSISSPSGVEPNYRKKDDVEESNNHSKLSLSPSTTAGTTTITRAVNERSLDEEKSNINNGTTSRNNYGAYNINGDVINMEDYALEMLHPLLESCL